MKLWSDSFKDGDPIPAEFAFGEIDPAQHVSLSANKNPHLAWGEWPAGTKSLVLICHDPDVPSRGDDVNQEGKTVPADLPRVDFYHWVMVDIEPLRSAIEVGEFSSGVTARGKSGPEILGSPLPGARHGKNDYTGWFAGDAEMAGNYFGYDGPCPPWNDAIVHHYVFTMYALDVERLPLTGDFGGAEVKAAMAGHVLGQAQITGTYTLNPDLAPAA